VDDNITGKRREVMRWWIERNEGWRGGDDDWEEGRREVVRMAERKAPHYFSPPRLPLSLRPFYPLPSNLLFNTCFTTFSSLSSSLSPSFSILRER
jgi:hypothetical protein